MASVQCKKVVSLKLRGSMYKSCVRSVLRYGTECLTSKKDDERKLLTTEMRMLRMVVVKHLRDSKSNKTICEITHTCGGDRGVLERVDFKSS